MSFVDRVGLALLFPSDELLLPSLWEAVAGTTEITWSQRDAEGRFLDFSPEFGRVWRWKDELPERRLVCAGKHVAGRSAVVSLAVLPALVAVADRADVDPVERELVHALEEHAALTTPELSRIVGRERRRVGAALERLQRKLLVTGAGAVRTGRGWPAVAFDLLDRRYAESLRSIPPRDTALRLLAQTILRHAREVSAADVAAVLRCTAADAAAALDELVDAGVARRRDEEGFAIWAAIPAR